MTITRSVLYYLRLTNDMEEHLHKLTERKKYPCNVYKPLITVT